MTEPAGWNEVYDRIELRIAESFQDVPIDPSEVAGHATPAAFDALAEAGLAVVSADLSEALKLCGNLISCHSRDWGQSGSDAILWGVLCGWECEDNHTHDDICGGSDALEDIVVRYGWTQERIDRIKRLRHAVRALPERTDRAPDPR